MCGIIGFFNCGNKEELKKAVSTVSHRGPDFQDYVWFDAMNSGLGHTRLAIIDLSETANQPMRDEDSGLWIIYNGEIFNYKNIRKNLISKGYRFKTQTDTEVILKSYDAWGEACLNEMNGMFSFVIYDPITGKIFAARDRLGIKPFYYFYLHNKLIIASEIKSILACSNYIKEPDYKALYTPVHYQVSTGTGFKDIKKLPAGCFLTYDRNGIDIKRYWDINPVENGTSYDFAYKQLDELLKDSINIQLVSDVPVGSLLSGGLDSSLISVIMQKLLNSPLNTFTIKFKHTDLKKQGNVDDSYFAKKLAEQFSFNHHEIEIKPDILELLPKLVWHLEEPIADPAAINTYLISKAASDSGIKVLLTGMGADEIFSGYRSHLACLKADSYQKIPQPLRIVLESFSQKLPQSSSRRNYKYIRWLKSFLRISSLPQRERSMLIANSALSKDAYENYFVDPIKYYESSYVNRYFELYDEHPGISYLTKMCYVNAKTYLTDHNLNYSDKAMMAAGVEGRPPLIDHRIVEHMFRLGDKFRIRRNTQKYILKRVAEKYLPREIIYRSKAPFSAPLRGWLKCELSEMVNDILSYASMQRRGIYNPKYVQSLINNNNKGLEDNSQLIWRLMVNEIWFRTFFD